MNISFSFPTSTDYVSWQAETYQNLPAYVYNEFTAVIGKTGPEA